MTLPEISREFDILYNNIMSNQAPGLDEYEKSVLLTKSQDEILKNYFNPNSNTLKEGFDDSAKRQIDFSKLIKTYVSGILVNNPFKPKYTKFDDRSILCSFPPDVLFIINESAKIIEKNTIYENKEEKYDTRKINIVPISYDLYSKLISKPYKYPNKSQGWRLLFSNNNIYTELILSPNSLLEDYRIRYVRRPKPIILVNLNEENGFDGLSIDGESSASECELDPIIHKEIIQRAVEIAKITYVGFTDQVIKSGERSE